MNPSYDREAKTIIFFLKTQLPAPTTVCLTWARGRKQRAGHRRAERQPRGAQGQPPLLMRRTPARGCPTHRRSTARASAASRPGRGPWHQEADHGVQRRLVRGLRKWAQGHPAARVYRNRRGNKRPRRPKTPPHRADFNLPAWKSCPPIHLVPRTRDLKSAPPGSFPPGDSA